MVYKVERSAGYTLARYERSGLLDYETYRSIQEIGNKHKLDVVFTTEAVIRLVCEHSPDAKRILCHGTRNGAEQRWFRQHLPHAEILGTEISETATQFPMTVQWDFHEVKPEWLDYWDVIYSNSWDHTYAPDKLFAAWASSLREDGHLYLEHTEMHELVDHLDHFGATTEALVGFVEEAGLIYETALNAEPSGVSGRQVLIFSKPQLGSVGSSGETLHQVPHR